MKFLSTLASLVAVVAAAPSPTIDEAIVKRATVTDVAFGFASQNGGTKGGAGGTVTTVSTLPQFTAAVNEKDATARIVVVQGIIKGSAKIRVGSNKSIIGLANSGFEGIGLHIRKQSNVIVRNIKSSYVQAENEDAIKIESSTNVWVDHCEFWSTQAVDKDYYDGLVDASHGSDLITISYTHFHDHWKASLAGHSDSNSAEDKGKLRITYANNYWKNINSRTPLLRFGTAHVYNSYYDTLSTGVNSRMGAQALVESTVFVNSQYPLTSRDSSQVGYIVAKDVQLGGGTVDAPVGSISSSNIPYSYSLLGSSNVASTVPGQAGARLTF
jgi:pectate lyase